MNLREVRNPQPMKVAVLYGGFSEERHSSSRSAQSIYGALERNGHEPCLVEYDADCIAKIRDFSPDAVFQITQGKRHGDGAAQAILELLGVPYTGSRPAAAAIINHKTACKKLCAAEGITTPDFFEYSHKEYREGGFDGFIKKAEASGLCLPIVVKPPTQGGRFGMVFVKDEESFRGIEAAFRYDDALLAERYVEGRFITQGLIEIDGEMTVLPPVEVVDETGEEFRRYYEKSYCIVPELTAGQISEINLTSLAVARLTGASGIARIDYHISGGRIYFLEINAAPGLTDGFSDMVYCAGFAGYTYDELISAVLASARAL